MERTVRHWSSPEGFLAKARDFLVAREAEHCLMLGLVSTMLEHPEIYPAPRLWTVEHAGGVVAAAIRTPPYNLILSQIDEPRWLSALAAEVLASDTLPGVHGPTAAARTLAELWSARTGGTATRVVQERIFRLDRVVPPRPAPGRCREVEDGDRARLAAWLAAFHAEALPDLPAGDPAQLADRILLRAGRVGYVWEDAGEAVALACVAGPTPSGIRIGPVYTPPAVRGRGYASNLVAEVSQRQLAAGRRFCFLFTNLANPTSNHIYQQIGYVPVTDVDQYNFS
jgi:predicted GNAT family acetyltransferase